MRPGQAPPNEMNGPAPFVVNELKYLPLLAHEKLPDATPNPPR
jgi:hypothetical protein